MERDFLGLSSKEPLVVVKEEVDSDGFKDIGFSKGSGMKWPFPNKVSALPHLMPFKVSQEDKTKKRVANNSSLVPPGLLSLSTADPFGPTKRPAIAEVQKSLNHDRQSGDHFTAYAVQNPQTFPVSSYPNSISTSNPFSKNHYTSSFQNIASATIKPQSMGGIPVATPQPIRPTAGYITGITELCSKPCSAPTQLTIFYGGTVNVYDCISPEKAEAIMLLAGNGSPISSSITQPKIQVQEPSSKAVVVAESRPASTSPSSRISSPLSVSSHAGAQSGSGSTSTEDILAAKETTATTTTTTPISQVDTPKVANLMGSTTLIPSAVPQARKASLARFLEKRKERVMNSAPYNLSKKSDGMDIHL